MNTAEFSDKFDILLNSYNSVNTFGSEAALFDFTVDEYEKSAFLTMAQKALVVSYYSGAGSTGPSFEEKEIIREALDALVNTKIFTAESVNLPETFSKLYAVDSQFPKSFAYNITLEKGEILYIIFEKVKFSDYISGCENKEALVVPSTHDELWHRMHNPFRGPSGDRVLRLNADNNTIELISNHPIGSYILRYVREPKPIILTDLPPHLAIDGETEVTECELPSILHDTILDAAVKLAIQAKSVGKKVESGESKK